MYLVVNMETKEFLIIPTIEGLELADDDDIEIHGDNRRGRVLKKEKGKKQKKLKGPDIDKKAKK